MNAGELREKIQLLKQVSVSDGAGGSTIGARRDQSAKGW